MSNENMFIYKALKPVLSTIYKLWYNPKIIGRESIPKEGSIVVVGNHIHIMDQCNVIISTKRNILKENLLGSLKLLGVFLSIEVKKMTQQHLQL